jgi:hypothetical protein
LKRTKVSLHVADFRFYECQLRKVKEEMQGQGFDLNSIRQMVEDKVMAAVDGVLGRIPNGPQYRDHFHQAIGGAINELHQQAQSRMGNLGGMLGNLGGMSGRQPDQGNPPVH